MARERVSNRQFHDAFILPPLPPDRPLDPVAAFGRQAPLELDLGCGRGRFLLARAAANPGMDFLGVDRLLIRLRKLDRRAVAAGLSNIRLLRGDAEEVIGIRIPTGAVSTCYVYFPDPWPKRRHHGRRLVSPAFVDALDRILSPSGVIHLATDHADYFAAMQKVWDADLRFQRVPPFEPAEHEETDFGVIFRAQGLTVGRCSYARRTPVQASGGQDPDTAIHQPVDKR